MDNHEYAINYYQGDYDVCSCFGHCDFEDNKTYRDYLTEMGFGDVQINAYQDARRGHMKAFENIY